MRFKIVWQLSVFSQESMKNLSYIQLFCLVYKWYIHCREPHMFCTNITTKTIYWTRVSFPTQRYSFITKTCLYNVDPLKPHFYIIKLGFTGVYVIFLFSAQNTDCRYSLEPPQRSGSNEYHNLCFEQKYGKKIRIFIWKFSIFGDKIFFTFKQACFRNDSYVLVS